MANDKKGSSKGKGSKGRKAEPVQTVDRDRARVLVGRVTDPAARQVLEHLIGGDDAEA